MDGGEQVADGGGGDPGTGWAGVAGMIKDKPVMELLDRIITEYLDTEDRIRLSGQCADGAAVVP